MADIGKRVRPSLHRKNLEQIANLEKTFASFVPGYARQSWCPRRTLPILRPGCSLFSSKSNGREENPYGGAVGYDPAGPSLVCSCTEEIQNAIIYDIISRHGPPKRRPVRLSMTIMGFKLQRRIPRYRLQSSYMVAGQARRGNNSLMPCRAMAAEEHCGRN